MADKLTYSDSKNIEHLFRQQSGKMFSILIRLFGFDNSTLIEDIIQESFLSAMKTWSIKGIPDNPEAWLMQVSKNKLINELKKRTNRTRLNEQFAGEKFEEKVEELFLDTEIEDSQLRALFACCHPVLSQKEQIMTTLKILSGFSNIEIASGLLCSPSSVKKALYRAKKKLIAQDIALNSPFIEEAKDRIHSAHTIIYLIFNEGYKSTESEHVLNEDLCFEATRLALLVSQIEGQHQHDTYALLSLIYFSMSRFPSRLTDEGDVIELQFQDREKWDQEMIEAGIHFLNKAQTKNSLSKYYLEATIASIHCSTKNYENTDWKAITICYDRLLEIQKSPVLVINRIIAKSKWDSAEQALKELEDIESDLNQQLKPLFCSAKADILLNLKRYDLAKSYYQVACDLSKNNADKKFLLKKVYECDRKNVSKN